MSLKTTFYLDGPSLGSATTVYTNADLTSVAADGFFSDGLTTVKQVSGVIVAVYGCPQCVCETQTISSTGGAGIYNMDLIAGGGAGAIIIKMTVDIGNAPVGFRVIEEFLGAGPKYYNNIVNKEVGHTPNVLSSFSHPSSPGRYVHVGQYDQIGSCCGTFGTSDCLVSNLNVYNWNGSSFEDTLVDVNETVYASDVFGIDYSGLTTPEEWFMVIPKTVSPRKLMSIQAFASCTSNNWSVEVQCPRQLLSFAISAEGIVNCDTPTTAGVAYNAPVNGVDGSPGLYDFIFSDPNGETPYPDGTYRISNDDPMSALITITNGIITNFTSCP